MIDRRLELLRVVAEFGTITAAAEAMYRSASGVSRQLQELAHDLGVVLFEPEGRRLRLTPAARILISHADAVHAEWERTRGEIERHMHEPLGPVRIAAFPTALAALVPPLIPRMRSEHPGLTVQAIEAEPAECFRLLLTGEADLGIAVAEETTPVRNNPKFTQRNLVREPIDLLVPYGHPFTSRTTIALIEAAEEPWIIGPRQQAGHDQILVACRAAGFTPSIAHHAQEWTAVAALVGEGHGVSLVSRLAALPPQFRTTRVPLAGDPAPARQILTCSRSGTENHISMATTRRLLTELAKVAIRSA